MFAPLRLLSIFAVLGLAALSAAAAIRKKPGRNRSRKDPSLPVFPPIAGITASLSGGSVLLTGDVPLVVTDPRPTDITLTKGGTVSQNVGAWQITPFTVALKADEITTMVATNTAVIGSQMTGIRSSRGGMLQIGQYTF